MFWRHVLNQFSKFNLKCHFEQKLFFLITSVKSSKWAFLGCIWHCQDLLKVFFVDVCLLRKLCPAWGYNWKQIPPDFLSYCTLFQVKGDVQSESHFWVHRDNVHPFIWGSTSQQESQFHFLLWTKLKNKWQQIWPLCKWIFRETIVCNVRFLKFAKQRSLWKLTDTKVGQQSFCSMQCLCKVKQVFTICHWDKLPSSAQKEWI